MQRNEFIVHSSEREEGGVGWGYLCIENINDRKDKIRQSLGIQDTALSSVSRGSSALGCDTQIGIASGFHLRRSLLQHCTMGDKLKQFGTAP